MSYSWQNVWGSKRPGKMDDELCQKSENVKARATTTTTTSSVRPALKSDSKCDLVHLSLV